MIKSTIFLVARSIAVLLITLVSSRLLLSSLGLKEFGILSVINSVVILFSFVNSTLSSVYVRYFALELGKKEEKSDLNTLFNTSLILQSIISFFLLLLFGAGYTFLLRYGKIPADYNDYILWIYLTATLTFVMGFIRIPFNSMLLAKNKMSWYSILGLIEVLLKLASTIVLDQLSTKKIVVFPILGFVSSVLVTVATVVIVFKSFPETSIKLEWNKSRILSFLRYTSFNTIGNFAAVFVIQGQMLLVNNFFGPMAAGAYGIAQAVIGGVGTLTTSIYAALTPNMIRFYSNSTKCVFNERLRLIMLGNFLFLLITCTAIISNSQFILDLWLTLPPLQSALFIRLALINIIIYNFVSPMIISIEAKGEIKKLNIYTGLLNILNIPISLFLLKMNAPVVIIYQVQLVINILIVVLVYRIQKELGFLGGEKSLTSLLFLFITSTLVVCFFSSVFKGSFILITFGVALNSILSLLVLYLYNPDYITNKVAMLCNFFNK